MANGNTLETWRAEILSYLEEMYKFHEDPDPYEILRKLSAFSARASFFHQQAARSSNRAVTEFKLDEVAPFLEEVDRQYRIWSRMVTVTSAEWQNTQK